VSLDPEDHVTVRVHRAAAAGEPAAWFHDELRQPARADEVAVALWQLVGLGPDERAGCWHLPGPEVLSRFEIAIRTARALRVDTRRIRPQATPADAVRPEALVLGDDRSRHALGWAPTPIFDHHPRGA
jgi:dTDP-4-dehydrorhamnose reductase